MLFALSASLVVVAVYYPSITNPIIRGPIMIRDNGEGNGWELVTSIDETITPDFPVT